MNTLTHVQNQPKPAKERKVSKRVSHAIDLLVSGQCKTQKDAAEKAGLTRERFCRALKESHVQEYLGAQTRVALAQSQAPAAATLITLMEQARSEHVKRDCATTILAYSGIRENDSRGPLVSIALGAGPGYMLDLRLDQSQAGISTVGAGGGVIVDNEPPTTRMVDVTPERSK